MYNEPCAHVMINDNTLVRFALLDKLYSARTIEIYGDITRDLARSVMRQVIDLNNADHEDSIVMLVDSDGGDVDAGLMIVNAIAMSPAHVITICVGKACSMGAVIMVAGDTRLIMPHSKMMIHQPFQTGGGGTAARITDQARELEKTSDKLTDYIAQRTGHTHDEIKAAMDAETRYTAQEAVDFGLCDQILTSWPT